MGSKLKPPKRCSYCHREYPARRKTGTCGREECVIKEITEIAKTNVRKEGDCEIWLGFFRQKGHVATIYTAIYDEEGSRGRKDFRVLQLRWPTPEHANGRVFENTCGNRDCVALKHNILRAAKRHVISNVIPVYLPVEPLVEYVERYESQHPDRTLGPGRDRLVTYRNRGRVSVTSADSFCIDVLGVHPTAVYGDLFFTEESAA